MVGGCEEVELCTEVELWTEKDAANNSVGVKERAKRRNCIVCPCSLPLLAHLHHYPDPRDSECGSGWQEEREEG